VAPLKLRSKVQYIFETIYVKQSRHVIDQKWLHLGPKLGGGGEFTHL